MKYAVCVDRLPLQRAGPGNCQSCTNMVRLGMPLLVRLFARYGEMFSVRQHYCTVLYPHSAVALLNSSAAWRNACAANLTSMST